MNRKEMQIDRYADVPRLRFRPSEGVDFKEINIRIPAITDAVEEISFIDRVDQHIRDACGINGCIGESVMVIDKDVEGPIPVAVSRAAILCFMRDGCPLDQDEGPGGYHHDREPLSPLPLAPSTQTNAQEALARVN